MTIAIMIILAALLILSVYYGRKVILRMIHPGEGMTRVEQYHAGEYEKLRVDGTAIGKAAVAEFVRGFELRMESPYELKEFMIPENKIAMAANLFFKWLAEIPGYGGDIGDSARILTVWQPTGTDKIAFVSNMLSPNGEDEKYHNLLAVADLITDLAKHAFSLADEYHEKYGRDYINPYEVKK